MKRALILGGGGPVGIAWEAGIIAALMEGAVDCRQADVIVGTSAGSFVGTRLASGYDPAALFSPSDADRRRRFAIRPDGGFDTELQGRIFHLWGSAERMTEELAAEIGRLALSARTISEAAFLEKTGGAVGVDRWPDMDLRVTAVDADTGELVVFGAERGVPIERAVGASCAVPGIFPVVTAGGRHCMDGGVRSAMNADLVEKADADVALIIAPMSSRTMPFALPDRQLERESAILLQRGLRVFAITPNDADVAAFGPNLLSAGTAQASYEAGRARGREAAPMLRQKWGAE